MKNESVLYQPSGCEITPNALKRCCLFKVDIGICKYPIYIRCISSAAVLPWPKEIAGGRKTVSVTSSRFPVAMLLPSGFPNYEIDDLFIRSWLLKNEY